MLKENIRKYIVNKVESQVYIKVRLYQETLVDVCISKIQWMMCNDILAINMC